MKDYEQNQGGDVATHKRYGVSDSTRVDVKLLSNEVVTPVHTKDDVMIVR